MLSCRVYQLMKICYFIFITEKHKDGAFHFHGLVRDENLVKTKNQRGIVRKIKQFIEFLDNNDNFETEYLDIGDGIAISRRK